MNLREIVDFAIAAVEGGSAFADSGESGERRDNGDGTVTLTYEIEIDPQVQAKYAAAMGKGETREDQADMELAEDETPEPAQPSAPQTQKARHTDTPLENCRAKDPFYCPYHGAKKMTELLNGEFASLGLGTANAAVELDGRKIKISLTVAQNEEKDAKAAIDKHILSKKGVSIAGQLANNTVEAKIDRDVAAEEREGLLGEWVDNIMERLSADPAMKKEIGRTDFVNMLTKVGEYYDAKENLSKNPADANLIAAKDAAEKSATEAVDAIGAMIDFKDVKTVADAEQLDGEYSKSIADSKTKYAPVSAAVAAKKTSLFGKDKFPTGFSAQNPWAADKKQYGVVKELSDFSTTGRKLAETVNGMKAALGAVSAQQSDKTAELSYAQKKQLRIALARMESMADEVAGHALHNEHKGQRLLQKLDEWAAQNPGGWVAPKKAKAPPPGGQQ